MSNTLDALNTAAQSMGGRWLKLRTTDDPAVDGVLLDFEQRQKTFEGEVVRSRKSGDPRIEWVFTFQTNARDDDDDDGIRKWSANESAQRAVAAAIKEAKVKAETGGRLKVKVKADPENDRSQAEYVARYEPPVKTADADDFLTDDL